MSRSVESLFSIDPPTPGSTAPVKLLKHDQLLSDALIKKLKTGPIEEAMAKAKFKYNPGNKEGPTKAGLWLQFDQHQFSKFNIRLSGRDIHLEFKQAECMQDVLDKHGDEVIKFSFPPDQILFGDNSVVTPWEELGHWEKYFKLPDGASWAMEKKMAFRLRLAYIPTDDLLVPTLVIILEAIFCDPSLQQMDQVKASLLSVNKSMAIRLAIREVEWFQPKEHLLLFTTPTLADTDILDIDVTEAMLRYAMFIVQDVLTDGGGLADIKAWEEFIANPVLCRLESPLQGVLPLPPSYPR